MPVQYNARLKRLFSSPDCSSLYLSSFASNAMSFQNACSSWMASVSKLRSCFSKSPRLFTIVGTLSLDSPYYTHLPKGFSIKNKFKPQTCSVYYCLKCGMEVRFLRNWRKKATAQIWGRISLWSSTYLATLRAFQKAVI